MIISTLFSIIQSGKMGIKIIHLLVIITLTSLRRDRVTIRSVSLMTGFVQEKIIVSGHVFLFGFNRFASFRLCAGKVIMICEEINLLFIPFLNF